MAEAVFNLDQPQPGQRTLRVDVFWCRGEGEDARREQARRYADELARYAYSLRNDAEPIGSVRVRALEQRVNYQLNYSVTRNEIRYETGDPFERAWGERLLKRWPTQFFAQPIESRTTDYISLFVCGGR